MEVWDVFAGVGAYLNDEVTDHSSIAEMHARPKGVENASNAHFDPILRSVRHGTDEEGE